MAGPSKEIDVGIYSKDKLLSQIEIINIREKGGLIDAYVPRKLILREEVPVDDAHSKVLMKSMVKEEADGKQNGQLSAMLLGYVKGSDYFRIMDGFHRDDSNEKRGKDKNFCTIRMNCTEEDVINYRIMCAVGHKSICFPRIVAWSQEAWNFTPWSKKVKLLQAFNIRFPGRKKELKFDLNEEEASGIKEWIDDNCKKWGIHAPTLRKYLEIGQVADPDLIKKVRHRSGGGRERLVALTTDHLKAVVEAVPKNYPLQRLAAEAIINYQLRVSEATVLAKAISRTNTIEEAKQIIRNESWRKTVLQKKSKPYEKNEVRATVFDSGKKEAESLQIKELREQIGNLERESEKIKGELFLVKKELSSTKEELFSTEDRIAKIFINPMRNKEEILKDKITDERTMQMIKKVTVSLPSQIRTVFILQKKYGLSVIDVAGLYRVTEKNIIECNQNIREIIKESDPVAASILEKAKAKKSEIISTPVKEVRSAAITTSLPKVSQEKPQVIFPKEKKPIEKENTIITPGLQPPKTTDNSKDIYGGEDFAEVIRPRYSVQNRESKIDSSVLLKEGEIYVIIKRLLSMEVYNKQLLTDFNVNMGLLNTDEIKKLLNRVRIELDRDGKDKSDFEKESILSARSKLSVFAKNPREYFNSCGGTARVLLKCFDLEKIQKPDFWEKFLEEIQPEPVEKATEGMGAETEA